MVNGNDYGRYIFEDFTRDGVLPGDTPDIASGNVRWLADFGALFYAVATNRIERLIHQHPWPLTRAELLALHDEVADEIGPLIAADPLYPDGFDRLQRQFREDRRRIAAPTAGAHSSAARPGRAPMAIRTAGSPAGAPLPCRPSSIRRVFTLARRPPCVSGPIGI